ncbi:L-gulono-gamma-lactone oxidase, partial [Pseudomonas savastanoi pv. glycinea]
LTGGHSGLLGIVVSMKLRAVKAFNLCETIELFPNTREMTGRLSDILKNNQYISIMGMPSYGCPESDKLVSKWQIRQWNYTTDKPGKKEKAPYDPDVRSFAQELQVRIGASVMDFLLDSGLKHLLPSFMLLSAAVVTGTRGTSPKVDYENHITHPQV